MPENEGQTPLTWLWVELERRYGPEVVEELRRGYNQQQRDYSKHRQRINAQWHTELAAQTQAEKERLERERAEAQRPWTQILLIPGDGQWAPILPYTIRDTFPHTTLKQDGENWLLSWPPGYVLSEQDERVLKNLIRQQILKSWQVLSQEEATEPKDL